MLRQGMYLVFIRHELRPTHVFQGVVETASQNQLSQTLAQRFGPLKDVEIVRSKACAFLEFLSLDAAKKAIIASLPQNQNGEGGVQIDVGGDAVRIFVETRKERGERPQSWPRGGGPMNGEARGGSHGGRGGPVGVGCVAQWWQVNETLSWYVRRDDPAENMDTDHDLNDFSAVPLRIPLTVSTVANALIKFGRARHDALNLASGIPITHPSLCWENVTCRRRTQLEHDDRYICKGAVNVTKLFRGSQASLLEKAVLLR